MTYNYEFFKVTIIDSRFYSFVYIKLKLMYALLYENIITVDK